MPRKAKPRFRHVTFRLNEEILDRLDKFAREQGQKFRLKITRTSALSAILAHFFEGPIDSPFIRERAIEVGVEETIDAIARPSPERTARKP